MKETKENEIEWKIVELKDVLIKKGYIRGPFGSALRRPELKKEGIPVYEQQNAIYDNRIFRFYIDEEKYEELKRFTVQENDLIISCSGTFGKVSIIKREDPRGIISQALLILRPNIEKINPNFLKYFFISDEGFNAIASRSIGSVQVNIAKREVIEKIELSIPNKIEEQDHIVKILSDLDSKIELNNKMNKTLEAIGQALFKKWFVEEKKEDWQVSKIGKEFKTILGGTPDRTNSDYWNGNINWINSGKVNEFRIIEPSEKITELGLSNSAAKIFPKGTTVLAITGATLGQVSRTEIETSANQSVIGIIENENISGEYLYFYIKNSISDIISHQTGGAQQHINKSNVDNYDILIPDKEILQEFNLLIKPIFKQISVNCFQSQKLSQIRDSLLPKLMSGEIRVK